MLSKELRIAAFSTAVIVFATASGSVLAQKKYDTGATDTEIKIGNIMPYSGPASAIFAVLQQTALRGTEEMRIVESAELLVHPKRRFDAVAVRGS